LASQTNQLGTLDVKKLLIRLSVPAIVAQLINALYNIVDRIYIGNMKDIGHLAITGVGLTFPIIMLISAFASLIGMGGAPLLSMSLGEKNMKKAQKILGTCMVTLVILAVILTAVFWICKVPFLYAFGASDQTISYADDYISIYLCGTIFVMAALGLNNFINAQGFTKIGMITVIVGAVCNIILDPIFIFAFGLGVRGAAIATVISQAVSAIWVLCFLFGKKATVKVKWKFLRIDWRILGSILALGVSPFIMQSTESLVMIVLNSLLQYYGNDYYVGAMTIISSVSQLVMMPMTGLSQGAQPIISYNYGAEQLDRVRRAFHLLLRYCATYSTIIWLAFMIVPQAFVYIFNSDPKLVETAVPALRIQMGMIFAMGVQHACQNSFLSLGQAKISLLLALLRKIVLLIPLAFILPIFLGVDGIFYAQPVADILAASTTATCFGIFYHKHLKKQ
jgi:putative MATE family efflux protein